MDPQMSPEDGDRDEAMVRILRDLLKGEELLPLGLRSRLEAELLKIRARERRLTWTALLVLGAVLFTVAVTSRLFLLSGPGLALLAVGAIAYACSLRSLLSRHGH